VNLRPKERYVITPKERKQSVGEKEESGGGRSKLLDLK